MQIQNIAFNESAIPGRYPMTYRVRDVEKGFPARTFDVLATRDEIDFLAREGYLIRERLIPMAQVEILRAALDECVARDQHLETMGGRKFGGIFIRYLMDKHPAFLGFLKFQPTLSIARAMFGSMVQLRGFVGRVVYPTSEHSETVWHFHQRLIPDPLPPWLARPQTLDVLLYLDDLTDENGPLCIMPQSHNWLERDQQDNDFRDLPGQKMIKVPAGSVVFCHGSLWHRAMPTRSGFQHRRLLLFGYGPGWMKQAIYGVKPQPALTDELLKDADDETRELLGLSGFM